VEEFEKGALNLCVVCVDVEGLKIKNGFKMNFDI
jgi:hypothetical protein